MYVLDIKPLLADSIDKVLFLNYIISIIIFHSLLLVESVCPSKYLGTASVVFISSILACSIAVSQTESLVFTQIKFCLV